MNAPILHCKTRAEIMRVANWLSNSGMAFTIRFKEKEIQIGTTGEPPNSVTLQTYKAAPDLLAACLKAEYCLDFANIEIVSAEDNHRTLKDIRKAIQEAKAIP